MTQHALADQVGVSEKHLSNVLNDRARLTPGMAARLTKATGLELDDLIGHEPQYGRRRSYVVR
jgi:plasmid maintenance system antidote protein VapI